MGKGLGHQEEGLSLPRPSKHPEASGLADSPRLSTPVVLRPKPAPARGSGEAEGQRGTPTLPGPVPTSHH